MVGASAWRQFRDITVPLLTSTLFFVSVQTVNNKEYATAIGVVIIAIITVFTAMQSPTRSSLPS